MTFGQIMKDLRRKHDMTQEGLAETLGITGQAVSRWENDLAMPDISLLPVLANLFEVTTDYLLGVDITQKESKIQEILREAHQRGIEGNQKKAVEIIRTGLKEYPGSHKLMYWLMFHLSIGIDVPRRDKAARETLLEVASLGEKILAECTDDTLRHSTIEKLCACYADLGEQEKMGRLANTMPGIWESRDSILAMHTRGDEQLTAKRAYIRALLDAAAISLSQLHYRNDTGGVWEEMPPEAILQAQKDTLAIMDILCPDGDYGSLDATRGGAYRVMADICFEAGDWDTGIEHLAKAVAISVRLDTEYDGKKKHTSPLFDGSTYGHFMLNRPHTFSEGLLDTLRGQSYFGRLIATEKGRELIAHLG